MTAILRFFHFKNFRNPVIIQLYFVLFLFSSCTKNWLDKKPDLNTTIPASLKDCQILLDRNDLFNAGSPALGELASDGHFVIETRIPTMGDVARNAYTWSNELPYREVPDWIGVDRIGPYGIVFTCNLIMETLIKIPVNESNQQLWNSIKGQALFQRARAFYELAQLFAPPYKPGALNDALGIPLRLASDINLPTVRSSVQQTYDRIILDLKEAEILLPLIQEYKTQASKSAALAMLARVYLSMEDYDNAYTYANEVLLKNNSLLDYSKLTASDPFPVKQLNDEVIFHSTLTNYSENTSGAQIDGSLKNLYHVNDLRDSVFFLTTGGQTTFKGYYSGIRLCFNGLATDEMYLIRAECRARAGETIDAMNDINTLLKNRFKKIDGISTYVDQVAANPEEALGIVLNERRKELLLRGLRWSDLRRLNRDPRFAVTLSRTVSGKLYTLEPNSYKYTFPIPIDIIQMTGILQNLGWDQI